MEYTLVYVTYSKDLEWLRYSLLSVNKFATSASSILIFYHDVCYADLNKILSNIQLTIPVRLAPVHYDYHGYIKQMTVKLKCWRYVSTPFVVFVDSDNIFSAPYSVQSDKLIWYFADRTTPGAEGGFSTWESAIKKMTFEPMNKYYMANAFPFVIRRETLAKAEAHFEKMHGQTYDSFCLGECTRLRFRVEDPIMTLWPTIATVFEEFEWLGWYTENYTTDYVFIHSTARTESSPIKQFWSHGGITPDIRKQIDDILGTKGDMG